MKVGREEGAREAITVKLYAVMAEGGATAVSLPAGVGTDEGNAVELPEW